eukprot:gene15713-7007_t
MSTKLLHEHMKAQDFAQNFRILNATWDLPSAGRNPAKEHIDARIPGSVFFDIDYCSEKSTSLPHMLPTAEQFQDYVSDLGVTNSHHIILYDNHPKFGKKSGFIAEFHPEMVKGFERIKEIVEAKNAYQIVDARPNGRFHGTSPEPRPEIPSGHMPGSLSVPFMECLNESRELKSANEIQSLFKEKGVDLGRDMIASCGSGVSACILALSVYVSSNKEIPVYDGSWTEWATRIPALIEKD